MLNHHGVAEVTIGNGIAGFLLPLAALVADGGNDHALGSVDGRKVNGGKVGRHWSDPLWDSGEWLRGRVSNEPLALNAVIIAHGTEV